ncbi:MAG: hypothetical protein LBT53_07770 [Puniceicoccales bacterium]|jgi:hypothetical protein|nr:hypothetical protein [Puniceicoccales bacterium]
MFAETSNPPRSAAAAALDSTAVAGAASAAAATGTDVSASVSYLPAVGGIADAPALHPSIAYYQYAPQIHPDVFTAIPQPAPDRNLAPVVTVLLAADVALSTGKDVAEGVLGVSLLGSIVETAGNLASSAIDGVSEIGSTIYSALAEAVALIAFIMIPFALYCFSTPISHAAPIAPPPANSAITPANSNISAAAVAAPAKSPATAADTVIVHSIYSQTQFSNARVLSITSGTAADYILLNAGYRQNFRPGMQCQIFKNDQAVATLVIADSTLDRAVALLISDLPAGTTLASGDLARLKLIR